MPVWLVWCEVVYEHHLSFGQNLLTSLAGWWQHWETRVNEFIYPESGSPDYTSFLVPNVDNVRMDFIIHIISQQGKVRLPATPGAVVASPFTCYFSSWPGFTCMWPQCNEALSNTLEIMCFSSQGVLLIGEPGSAKTVTINAFMKKYNPEDHLCRNFNFSSASTPMYFQVRETSYDSRILMTNSFFF